MEKIESIEHVLENMDKSLVYKAKKSALLNILLVVIGVVSFIVHSLFEWQSNSIYPPLLMTLGSAAILYAVFALFFQKSHYFSTENNQQLRNREAYFHVSERNKLEKLIETGNLRGLKDLKASVSDGLKLRVVATKDGLICLSQVVAYTTNQFENITPAKQHSLDDAHEFIEYFKQKGLK